MDRRQQKTRQAIFTAFEHLLATTPYDKITVAAIIDAANVGRSTFYAHFPTKDDLFKALCDAICAHVTAHRGGAEPTHDFEGKRDTRSAITHMFYHLQAEGRPIARVLASDAAGLFLEPFRRALKVVFARELADAIAARDDLPADFLLGHLVATFVETVRFWIDGGRRATPEELATCFCAVIDPVLR